MRKILILVGGAILFGLTAWRPWERGKNQFELHGIYVTDSTRAALARMGQDPLAILPAFSLEDEQVRQDWVVQAAGHWTRPFAPRKDGPRVEMQGGAPVTLQLPALRLPPEPIYITVRIEQVDGELREFFRGADLEFGSSEGVTYVWPTVPPLLRFRNEQTLKIRLHAKGTYRAYWIVTRVRQTQFGSSAKSADDQGQLAAEWTIDGPWPREPVLLDIKQQQVDAARDHLVSTK